MLLEPGREPIVDDALDHRTHFRGDKLILGLGGELRVRNLDREHRGEPFAAVVAGERDLLLARRADRLGDLRDLAGERAAEAGEMGAAVALRDRVGEAEHGLVVAIVPPQRAFDADAVALGLDHDRRGDERRLVAIQVLDELLDAALVVQLLALLDRMAHVGKHDIDAGIEEGELAQPVLQRGEVELGHGEGLGRRQERHLGAAPVLGVADHRERGDRVAVAELHHVLLAVAPDGELEEGRERVHHRDADAVQAAGNLVGVLVEFPAGVELGHDDLGRRHALALVDVGRDAAAVVAHGDRGVGVEGDPHLLGIAGERLVDGVVDHLVDHVVETRAVVGVADIHPRPLAHGIEALEDLDRFGVVVGREGWSLLTGRFSHFGTFELPAKLRRIETPDLTRKMGAVQAPQPTANILIPIPVSKVPGGRKCACKRPRKRPDF